NGYRLKIVASNPQSQSAPSEQALSVGACVWPGDANDDGTVDVFDFFFICGGYGLSGSPRAQISTIWAPAYPPEDWPAVVNFQGQTLNAKYLDANGDGSVNLQDAAAAIVNRGNQR
ncbi:MAG: hypothetical protein NZ534_02905, partial [Bacteroidia bacterium]|nr:hypothetical protein [Bacteroidia bacterium]